MTTMSEAQPVPSARARRGLTRRHLLLIVLALAFVALVVVLALQGAAADPMAGT